MTGMVDSVGMPQAYRTPARQLHGSMTIGLTCQLEESVAKRLASELAYALCVARPVLGDAVITILRLERLDHDTVDASKRARGLGSVLCRPDTTLGRGGARSRWRSSPEHQVMALLVQLVGRQISPRVQAALGCFPVHLERSEHARVVSERLPLCHSLLSRECRIARPCCQYATFSRSATSSTHVTTPPTSMSCCASSLALRAFA